jgi:hypothetical protein
LSERDERAKEKLEESADTFKERLLLLEKSLADLARQRGALEAHLGDRLTYDFGDDSRAQLQHDKL